MRKANEIGGGACARQGRGVHQKSAPFKSFSSLGFDLREEDRRGPALRASVCTFTEGPWLLAAASCAVVCAFSAPP